MGFSSGPAQPGEVRNPNGRPSGVANLRSKENQLRWRSKSYIDPLDFFGQIISDPEQPVDQRLAAGSLAIPYLHSKLAAIPVPPDPTFMEIKLKNPSPISVDQCVENINLLTQAKASGEVSIEHADSLIADQKVILYAMLDQRKVQNTEGGSPTTTIRIEGGLPQLPGTNINMSNEPELQPGSPMNGHAMDPPEPEPPPTDQDP